MYSFDKVNTDRWSELNDEYQSMLDELAEDSDTPDVFVKVADFDVDEVL
jgi:hypothetical protein